MELFEGERNKRELKRIEKTYEGTEVTVRMKLGNTESFITKRGVRQGYVMSPFFFNLYIADLDEKFRGRGIGGIGIDK